MREVCYCGHRADLEDRLPIVDERGQGALRCRECGHVDHLVWLPEDSRSKVLEEASRRLHHGEGMPLTG